MTDISGLTELVADLTAAPGRVQRKVDGVVKKGAVNIVKDARQRASGNRYAPRYPSSITFDSGWERGAYVAEIGPDKSLPGRQGALGNILEFGVPSKNTAPQPHLRPAFDIEEPKFVQAMENLADEAL